MKWVWVSGSSSRVSSPTLEKAWAFRRSYGAPDWRVAAWAGTYLQIANRDMDVVSDTVPRLTGHQALSLADGLAQHPEGYTDIT